jgi:hypothetical protein
MQVLFVRKLATIITLKLSSGLTRHRITAPHVCRPEEEHETHQNKRKRKTEK